ncbi:MAG: GNAT family protein [Candidatus Nanopelagicales bacterium]|nr:GNAT family protein [Candidatus Nanopelagicales bacterium]
MHDVTVVNTLKQAHLESARTLAIPVIREGEILGKLVPIGPWILADEPLIEAMAAWRARAMEMFLAQFESTPAKTAAYLRDCSIGQDNRVLFMIQSGDVFIGHVGLANIENGTGEVDNLMRGPDGGPRGLMSASERALVTWGFDVLGLDTLFLRGLSHNAKANRIHENLGFVASQTFPLRREPAQDGTILVPCSPGQATVPFTCEVMTLDRGRFQARIST